MSLPQFVIAILLLLGTPGPTNTLMALGGYSRGWSGALPLITAELAGYLIVIVPVATLAAPFFESYPQLAAYARLLAGGWVLLLSYRLWTAQKKGNSQRPVTWTEVLLTTLLNPKALIIALVIMPHEAMTGLLPWLALFGALVVLAANGWIVAGSLMARSARPEIRPATVQRVAAACLFLFAMLLASASLQSLA